MVIVLDNAESILDPQGTDARKIYTIVEELSRFSNICICITSRISTTPPGCKHLDVPTLSTDAARDTFYRIYDSNDRSDLINGVLEQLDFHPLSITLLATVAHQNKWGTNRLIREWERRRTGVLQTQHNESLAAAIELSLASPMFQELGPDSRALLGIVAFFPQGIDENNFEWLFPTIPNRTDVFDKFCILSLTYWRNGFVTMLAPLRDYLSPKDPKASPLLCATKLHYFTRLSVDIEPNEPGFGEPHWITLEDVNVEHLLDVFTTVDANSNNVWDACANFVMHLVWFKNRFTILKPKIEGLPDDHVFKPECLFRLSQLFFSVGDRVECKRLLVHDLELWRKWGRDHWIARTLMELSQANMLLGLREDGIQQAKEALEIYGRIGYTGRQAECLMQLGQLLCEDEQFDAAEKAAFRAINLLPEKGEQFRVCAAHRLLGETYQSKGDTEQAIHHFEVTLGIASPFNWHHHLFRAHYGLARLFGGEGRLDDANAHIELAKPHTVNNVYDLARAMELQADIWYNQYRLEEARSEALRAVDIYEKLGAAKDMEDCRELLQDIEKRLKDVEDYRELLQVIERELNTAVASSQSDLNCELL
jgi:tetratricopeptide (TPR) repeat protein